MIPVQDLPPSQPDLGDLVVILLGGTLGGLRDRLAADGFERAAEVVSELVDIVDDYLDEFRR